MEYEISSCMQEKQLPSISMAVPLTQCDTGTWTMIMDSRTTMKLVGRRSGTVSMIKSALVAGLLAKVHFHPSTFSLERYQTTTSHTTSVANVRNRETPSHEGDGIGGAVMMFPSAGGATNSLVTACSAFHRSMTLASECVEKYTDQVSTNLRTRKSMY